MKRFGVAIFSACLSALALAPASAARPAVDYLTYHGDNLRTGWNAEERVLNVASVSSSRFGLLTTVKVAGQVYAQPLYAARVRLPGVGLRNIVIVATEGDVVYALDADTGAKLWTRSFVDTARGVTPVPWTDTGCGNVAPEIGITSTPTIDRTRDAIYVAVATDERERTRTFTHIRLHKIGLKEGADKVAPVDIRGFVPDPQGKLVHFNQAWQMSRAALLESGGAIYVAFGSHCDFSPSKSHGWLFAYSADTLAPVGGIFNTSLDLQNANYLLASIWESGFGVAADGNGRLYAATGNGGDYDGSHNLPQSVLELSPGLDFPPISSFTTGNQHAENQQDADLGSGGVMLLPDQPGAYPHIAVAGGKTGVTYLLNRDDLGGYVPGGPDRVLFELQTNGGLWGGPAYYVGADGNPYIVVCGGDDPVMAYRLQTSPAVSLTLASEAARRIGSSSGTIPVVSSDGTRSGTAIVWALSRPPYGSLPVVLNAYAGANLKHQLFSGDAGSWNNSGGGAFLTPLVANGKVYVGSADTVAIFGLTAGGATVARITRAPEFSVAPYHQLWATVLGIRGTDLAVRLRTGRVVTVDATEALRHERATELFVGRPIVAIGVHTRNALFHATAIWSGRTNPQTWGPDR